MEHGGAEERGRVQSAVGAPVPATELCATGGGPPQSGPRRILLMEEYYLPAAPIVKAAAGFGGQETEEAPSGARGKGSGDAWGED